MYRKNTPIKYIVNNKRGCKMERTFKIAIQGINITWNKELIITVTLLELQDLQIKKVAFRYVIGG